MKPIVLTYYLPQFHEVEENNRWWGKGFTEWTNINDAVTYFPNQKIRKPIEPLGQYNLLNSDVIEEQFKIAKDHGIDGFMIWNYWFGNDDKILEKPAELIVKNDINVKFCFAWANHSWLNKSAGILLKSQKYLGYDDYVKYFNYLKPFFLSENYIKVENKPVFSVFRPQDIPDLEVFINCFNEMSIKLGYSGIYWLAENSNSKSQYINFFDNYYDSASFLNYRKGFNITFFLEKINTVSKGAINFGPFIYDFEKFQLKQSKKVYSENELPVVFTGWDTSIRHRKNGIVLKNFTEESFNNHVKDVFKHVKNKKIPILMVKSWNEWAEGNLLEPDSIFGFKMLKIFKDNC